MADPVYDFLNSGGSAASTGTATKTPTAAGASNDAVFDFLNSGGKTMPALPAPKQAAPAAPEVSYKPDVKTTPEVAASIVSGVGSSILGGFQGLRVLAETGSLDAAANEVRRYQQEHTYQPESDEAHKVLKGIASPANPLNWIPLASKKAGETAQDLGAPPSVATAIEGAGNVVGTITGGRILKSIGGGKTVPGEAEAVPTQRIEPTLSAGQSIEKPIVKAAPPQRIPEPLELAPETGRPRVEPTMTPAAKVATAEPTLIPATAPTRDRMATSAEIGEEPHRFLEGPPEASPGLTGESKARAAILRRVGLTEVRKSAIEGDAKSAATDYQSSKLDNPAGRHMQATLNSEKAALQDYSENLVRDTGGTMGTDTATLYSRGNTILAPLDELNTYFNKEVSKLYKEADARAQGQPVQMPKTQEFVGGDQAEFLGTTEGESLLRGIKARMKSLGMVDEEGAALPVTVKQAEQLKQYLNNQWQPRTSRLISGLKNAIDDDVTLGAGEDIYQKARAMRAMKAAVFENDMADAQGRTIGNGISKIVDANGKGVELLKDTEKIADVVTSLPSDQLGHIVKTLKSLPPELKPQGEAALAEIKAQFANKVHEIGSAQAGQWAARNVSKYLNKNAARLQQVFTPDELAKFNDLNDAGHILAKDQSYPGAAVQEHNLVQRGAMEAVRSGGAALGGTIGGGPGAAIGGFLGGKVASKMGESISLKSAQNRIIKLSDFPE